MSYLAADIGGTYSRFAWSDDSNQPSPPTQILRNVDFDSLDTAIEHALTVFDRRSRHIRHMVLALPGPVEQDPVVLTNIDWQIERAALRQKFAVEQLTIVNDFQAAALGALGETADRLKILNPGTADNGPRVVTGAGTGLGMAWFCDQNFDRLPQATEGGHLDFAPGNEQELALYRHLARRYGHVSYERILSGPGLLEAYRFLADGQATAQEPAEIAALANQGDESATATLQIFVDVFAAYTGNLALAFNPTGGIYLCGGLTIHLADRFKPDLFVTRYADKGRMAKKVRRIPVYLVSRHDIGLAGALDIAHQYDRADK